jgi:hypothetical protein
MSEETKTTSANDFFKSKEFDPSIYEEFAAAIRAGKRVRISNHKSFPERDARDLLNVTCSTIEEFDGEIYDIFINFVEPNQEHFLWGLDGNYVRNPIKRRENRYYDGLIFGRCGKEYRELLSEYTPARILSLAKHYCVFEGNGVLKLEII